MAKARSDGNDHLECNHFHFSQSATGLFDLFTPKKGKARGKMREVLRFRFIDFISNFHVQEKFGKSFNDDDDHGDR